MSPPPLPPPALDGEHAGVRLPKLRQMRMARVARRMMTWAAVALIVGASVTLVTPAVFAARPEDAPIPLAGMLVAAVQAVIPTLARWAITLAAVLVLAAALAWAPAWVQWRRARVPVALARRLRAGDRAGGIPLELLRIRIRWIPWQPWLPRRIRVRYPSGWVAADPSEELQELFLTDFRLPVRVDWQPAVDQIVVVRISPAAEPTAVPEVTRVEDQSPMVGGVHTSIGPLLGGLTVDQERTQLDEDGNVRELVLTYDQTTKDVSPRFRARVQSVIEAKVPSLTDAWTMRWQPDQHTVHVVPSEPLPEYAAYTGLPKGHNDPLAVPLGLGSGGRMVCWRPLKFPHMLLAGATGAGKALDLETPVATPRGWTTMGELRGGDELFDETGTVCRVLEAHPVRHDRLCYEVVFSDGERIIADAEHLWITWDQRTRKAFDHYRRTSDGPYPDNWATWSSSGESLRKYTDGERTRMREMRAEGMNCVEIGTLLGRTTEAIQQQWNRPEPETPTRVKVEPITTAQIAATLRHARGRNHAIPITGPLQYPAADLPVEPYVLGYLLGDGDTTGHGRVACDPQDREWLIAEFRRLGYPATPHADPGHFGVAGITAPWHTFDLHSGKFVPQQYLTASVEQRLALVQGLVDSDGYVDPHGSYRFSNTNPALIDGFCELVTGLGCVSQVHRRPGRIRAGNVSADSWDVIVSTALPLARLPRKVIKARRVWGREQVSRYIVDVRPVSSRPVGCITVDSPSRLYLVGRHMVPTHNTTCIRTVLVMALLQGWRVWILDPKQTSFQYFRNWAGVERVCITGEQIRQALLDHRDEMQEVYDGLLAGTITHDDITPLLLIFDEVTEGFADVAEWVEENFEDLKEDRPGAKLAREMKRGEFACWRVTRKGREARRWQLLGLQRPDTTFIPGEARDNLITRVAAGHLRADGLKMVFEDPSVRQRVTRPKIDPATGEDRGEPIPGRSTVDVGDGPEPLQWFYTPDPAPGRHTLEEMALLERLREQVERAQTARQQRKQPTHPTRPAASVGCEERRSESVAAADVEEGQWVLLDIDGGGERPVQIEGIAAEAEAGDDMVTFRYRVAAGGVGNYEIDCYDELVLVSGPAER